MVNYAMKPKMGDWVHFSSVCAKCNNTGRYHFTFTIDDYDLLAILPYFPKLLYTFEEGRRVNLWWDSSPNTLSLFKVKLSAAKNVFAEIFGIPEKHGFEDTYLIILGDKYTHITGPSRSILPLTNYDTNDTRLIQLLDIMNIIHFNYLDFRTTPGVK